MVAHTICIPFLGHYDHAKIVHGHPLLWQTSWCQLVGARHGHGQVTHFWYYIKDIIEEVHKYSSYLGKYRKSEDKQHLLDELELSQDEFDLLGGFTPLAMADVFDALIELTDHVPHAYIYDEDGADAIHQDPVDPTITPTAIMAGSWIQYQGKWYKALVDTDDASDIDDVAIWEEEPADFRHSVHYIIERPHWLNHNAVEPISIAIFNAIVYHIMWQWLQISLPDEAQVWYEKYLREIELLKQRIRRMRNNQVRDIIPRVF